MALLRDICMSIGLTLNFVSRHSEESPFLLEATPEALRDQLSQRMLKHRNQNQNVKSKKKG